MKQFGYNDNDPNVDEYVRIERNYRAAFPTLILVLLLMGWLDYALMAFAKEPVAPDNFVQVTGIVAEQGIYYKVADHRGIISDYLINKKGGYEVGETVTLYYDKDNPHRVGVLGHEKEWWRAIPLTILTSLDLWWLIKIRKSVHKHTVVKK